MEVGDRLDLGRRVGSADAPSMIRTRKVAFASVIEGFRYHGGASVADG
jgi:hypothetical protein